jgi:hypothetical protein
VTTLIVWALIVAFLGIQMALLAAAGIHRDGWDGWRNFWF